MFCAHRHHCEKGRNSKGGHHELCLQSGQQMLTWEHIIVDLPSSLKNFQKYVTSKFNWEICDEATDIFPRCFVSFLEENLEKKLTYTCGCLVFDSCNSLLLLFRAA